MLRTALLLALLAPLLQACLFVELTGNVAGAEVTLRPLRGGEVLFRGRTATVNDAIQRLGEEKFQGLTGLAQQLFVGYVEFSSSDLLAIEADRWYLASARGGVDTDRDGDTLLDARPKAVEGTLHAIISGEQLLHGQPRINLLSTGIYHLLREELAELDDSELQSRLDRLAEDAVPDMDGNGSHTYEDVLAWSQLRREFPYPGVDEFLIDAETAVAGGYDEDILDAMFENLVKRADWKVARPESRYVDDLIPCINPVLQRDLCDFDTLPLLGQQYPSPGVTAIMRRLVVTHDWMARRFEQVLRRLPPEFLQLFRPLSAVVIGDDIRPAYFDVYGPSIRIDPGYLWVTAEERSTVSQEADYRSAYARRVNFSDRWRYVRNGARATAPLDSDGNSTIEDVTLTMASLLAHELAHAGDFIAPQRIAQLAGWQTAAQLSQPPQSDLLRAAHPLLAVELFGIADVLFGGSLPDAMERSYGPAQIGALFAPDRASDLYSYYSQYEDMAMLFEEAMMAIHYGVQRDLAFTTVPEDSSAAGCDDYRIGWGVRGRVGAPQLRQRLEMVMSALLPLRDYSSELSMLPAPRQMQRGSGWCQALDLDGSSQFEARQGTRQHRYRQAPPLR
jgi:hypothetical protein